MTLTVPAAYRHFVDSARYCREQALRDTPEYDNLVPRAEFYRGGIHLATGFADAVNPERAMQMIYLGACGYAADRVDVLLDSTVTDPQAFRAALGRDPDPLEEQEADRSACDALVVDALLLASAYRVGRTWWACLAYHVHPGPEPTIHWLEDRSFACDPDDPDDAPTGGMADKLEGAFAFPTYPARVGVEPGDETDTTASALLTHLGFTVIVPDPDDPTNFRRVVVPEITDGPVHVAAEALRAEMRAGRAATRSRDARRRAARQ